MENAMARFIADVVAKDIQNDLQNSTLLKEYFEGETKTGLERHIDYVDENTVSVCIGSGMYYVSVSKNAETGSYTDRAAMIEHGIRLFLRKNYPYDCVDKENGKYEIDIYADYNDYFHAESVMEFLNSEDARCEFENRIIVNCDDYDRIDDKVLSALEAMDEFQDGLTTEEEDVVREYLAEHVCYKYPFEHYLGHEYKVPIMLDTGDGNFDYTLNTVYPHHSQEKPCQIEEKASLLWLAKQQGYRTCFS